jgi:hypothetical protein
MIKDDAAGLRFTCGAEHLEVTIRGVSAMPFEAYSAYFSPVEVKALSTAYDAAWNDLWAQRLTLPPDQIPLLKRKLAQLILASACNGKRDVAELKRTALRGALARHRHSA